MGGLGITSEAVRTLLNNYFSNRNVVNELVQNRERGKLLLIFWILLLCY